MEFEMDYFLYFLIGLQIQLTFSFSTSLFKATEHVYSFSKSMNGAIFGISIMFFSVWSFCNFQYGKKKSMMVLIVFIQLFFCVVIALSPYLYAFWEGWGVLFYVLSMIFNTLAIAYESQIVLENISDCFCKTENTNERRKNSNLFCYIIGTKFAKFLLQLFVGLIRLNIIPIFFDSKSTSCVIVYSVIMFVIVIMGTLLVCTKGKFRKCIKMKNVTIKQFFYYIHKNQFLIMSFIVVTNLKKLTGDQFDTLVVSDDIKYIKNVLESFVAFIVALFYCKIRKIQKKILFILGNVYIFSVIFPRNFSIFEVIQLLIKTKSGFTMTCISKSLWALVETILYNILIIRYQGELIEKFMYYPFLLTVSNMIDIV